MRILLIEDDPMIGNSLAKALRDLGMSVDWVTDGLDGEEALAADEHTLVLLNLGLPGKPGLQLLKAIRTAGSRVPIIIITARDGKNVFPVGDALFHVDREQNERCVSGIGPVIGLIPFEKPHRAIECTDTSILLQGARRGMHRRQLCLQAIWK